MELLTSWLKRWKREAMDPNETLRRLRALLGGDHSGYEQDKLGHSIFHHGDKPTKDLDDLHTMVCEAEELFQALDDWLSKEGCLPEAWERKALWGDERLT